MTIEGQIKDEELQYDINREAAKILGLSSGKLDKCKYLTGEEILPSNQQQIIQQAKFNYSPLGKALEKQRKTIEDQGEKQVDALKTSYKKLPSIKDFVPIEKFNPEIIAEIKRIEEIGKNVDRDKMVYEGTSRNYDFRGFKTIRAYSNDIRNNVISLKAANLEQTNLMAHIHDFLKSTKPQDPEQKNLKSDVLNSVRALVKGTELMYNAFRSGIFHRPENSQESEGANEMSRVNASERLKILTPNQMLKRLPIALAQVKAGNNSESLLNEIRQIVYSLYRSKEITKKVYNNIINSINV